MVTPELGMPVVYHQHGDDHFPGAEQLAGVISRIWTPTCVNLVIFDGNGVAQNRTSVLLWQGADGEPQPTGGRWCQFPNWFVRLFVTQPVFQLVTFGGAPALDHRPPPFGGSRYEPLQVPATQCDRVLCTCGMFPGHYCAPDCSATSQVRG